MNQTILKQTLLSVGCILIAAVLLLTWLIQNDTESYAAVPAIAPIAKSAEKVAANPVAEQESVAISEASEVKTTPEPPIQPATVQVASTAQEEGAPEGYVDPPPLCGELRWISQHGDPEMQFTTKVQDWQSDVKVSKYLLYVNGSLVDSSQSNSLNYSVSEVGTYNVYSIMETNFGTTLKSSLCEISIDVDQYWLLLPA